MNKDDKTLNVLAAIFVFLCGIIVGFIVTSFFALKKNAPETFNDLCTVITSEKAYDHCLIIDHDKENDFVEFKCDGKHIYFHGQYTIIKEDE